MKSIGEAGPIHLVVVFTYGYSLSLWHEAGIISRETRYYNELANRIGQITLLTYGVESVERELADRYLNKNVRILPKLSIMPCWLYSIVAPLLHYSVLRTADCIKTHQVWGAWTAIIARLILGVPLVIRQGYQLTRLLDTQNGGTIRRWLATMIEFLAYVTASRVIVASPGDAEFVREKYSIPQGKITLIPNYIDIELFRNNTPQKRRPDTLVYVGRLSPEKNVESLLAAARGLDLELKVIGDGPDSEKLRSSAVEMGANQVRFMGLVANENLPSELNRAGIFVMPSLHEGSPKALMEAMACGLPVIATNVPGTKDLVDHGRTGYLCHPSSDSLRDAIVTLIEDGALRRRLATNGRRFIVENFSLERILTEEVDVYRDLGSIEH